MGKIKINAEKCLKEGHCVAICCENHVFARDSREETPRVVNEGECILCGHCMAVCPGDAIEHEGMDMAGFKAAGVEKMPTPEETEELFFTMRSIRHYKEKPVPKEVIDRLVKAGAMAASDHNGQDRQFYVLSDKDNIHELARIISKHYRGLLRFMGPRVLKMVSPVAPELSAYLMGGLTDMRRIAKDFGRESDPIFHHAPCVVVITSGKGNVLGKDSAVTAQEAIRVLAHAMGLGTCISGYAIGAPPHVSDYLKIPKSQKVQTVFTLGYPVYKFRKTVDRKPPIAKFTEK